MIDLIIFSYFMIALVFSLFKTLDVDSRYIEYKYFKKKYNERVIFLFLIIYSVIWNTLTFPYQIVKMLIDVKNNKYQKK